MKTTINYDSTSITSTPVTINLSDHTVPEYTISTWEPMKYTAKISEETYDSIKKVFGIDIKSEKPEWKKLNDKIKRVVFNAPATIVLWKDGTKTVVKCGENETYDPEKGLAMALVKHFLGNKGNYYNLFRHYLKEVEE